MLITQDARHKARWSPVGRTETQQTYYQVRECVADYEHYWGTVKDPDGRVRDRLSDVERENYVNDRLDELQFIWCRMPETIVDFGCGPGWLLNMMPSSANRIGVDVSAGSLALLAPEIKRYQTLSDLADGECTMAVAYHVIEHIPDPIDTIIELRRVLRPSGWLILGTPDFDSPCAQRFGANYRLLHDPTHCSLFSLESMHRFLRDYGFVIHDVKFPFPERYATVENFLRWNDTSKVSPPWPGNWMTFYATRSNG